MTIQEVAHQTHQFVADIDPLKFGLFFFGMVFLFIFYKANRSNRLDWTDLITAKGTTKVSLTKLLQLVGGLTGTWVIMYQTMHNVLASEVFFIYLTYVGAVEAFSKFMAAKYQNNGGSFSTTETDRTTVRTHRSSESDNSKLPDRPPSPNRR